MVSNVYLSNQTGGRLKVRKSLNLSENLCFSHFASLQKRFSSKLSDVFVSYFSTTSPPMALNNKKKKKENRTFNKYEKI